MSEMNRREALKALGAAMSVPMVGAFGFGEEQMERARELAHSARGTEIESGVAYAPKFFTALEWAALRVLVDDIIPRDERSGSATDAAVPEYIDFLMADQTPAPREQGPSSTQVAVRGGLAWLDGECARRFGGKRYAACSRAERTKVLDDIAWPAKAKPELSHGAAFFTRMRDMTASGFFSSKIGVQDLKYMGNIPIAKGDGCPKEAVGRLGVG